MHNTPLLRNEDSYALSDLRCPLAVLASLSAQLRRGHKHVGLNECLTVTATAMLFEQNRLREGFDFALQITQQIKQNRGRE